MPNTTAASPPLAAAVVALISWKLPLEISRQLRSVSPSVAVAPLPSLSPKTRLCSQRLPSALLMANSAGLPSAPIVAARDDHCPVLLVESCTRWPLTPVVPRVGLYSHTLPD